MVTSSKTFTSVPATAAERKLLELLAAARPVWSDRDRAAAFSKLAKIGITSVESLLLSLDPTTSIAVATTTSPPRKADPHKQDEEKENDSRDKHSNHLSLNQRLRAAGLQTFTVETLQCFRAILGVPKPVESQGGGSIPNHSRHHLQHTNSSISIPQHHNLNTVTSSNAGDNQDSNIIDNPSSNSTNIATINTNTTNNTNTNTSGNNTTTTNTRNNANNNSNINSNNSNTNNNNNNSSSGIPANESPANWPSIAGAGISMAGGSCSSYSTPHHHPSSSPPPPPPPRSPRSTSTPTPGGTSHLLPTAGIVPESEGGAAAAAASGGALHGNASLLGTWLAESRQLGFEIRPDESGLSFHQRLPGGEVLSGRIAPVAGSSSPAYPGDWAWSCELSNGGSLTLRRDGKYLLSRYRSDEAQEWSPVQKSRRPELYVFFDANKHPQGHRYAHIGYNAGLGCNFPLVGHTAGWLPAEFVDPADREGALKGTSKKVRVRVLGVFCDPFDAAPPAPVVSQIKVVRPQPSTFGSGGFGSSLTASRVMLSPDGAVLLQPAMTMVAPVSGGSAAFPPWQRQAGKGSSKGKQWSGKDRLMFRPFSSPQSQVPSGPSARPWERPRPMPALDPIQHVASAFRTSKETLRDHAVFRGKLRRIPKTKTLTNQEVFVDVDSHLLWSSPTDKLGQHTALTPPPPLLTVVCVRWYDYWSDPEACSDYSTLNDGYFMDLFNGPCSMGQLLPGNYEVVTVFIRSSENLKQLSATSLRAMCRGRNVVAWYFVWPSTCPEEGAGYVAEEHFFATCQALEAAHMRMAWPHRPMLYRELCGKLWIDKLCHHARYRIPPTVRVDVAAFKKDPQAVATAVLDSLMAIRSSLWQKDPIASVDFKGVAKLGFSWCGSDVLPFKGVDSLIKNLKKLLESSTSNSTVCLVQEMVPSVVAEHRVVCMFDKATGSMRKESMWMDNMAPGTATQKYKMQALDVSDFKVASSVCVASSSVALRCFRGDIAAQRAVELRAASLVDTWMDWFQDFSEELPQCTRIDFLVSYHGSGHADVWTCEVGECGASLCSLEVHGRNLAALNNAISDDPSGRFPIPLPTTIPRNNGAKS